MAAGAALVLLLTAQVAAAAPTKVTYAKGKTEYLPNAAKHTKDGQIAAKAPWKALKKGAKLAEGAAVRTAADARLELKLGDGSRIRVDEKTTLALSQARMKGKQRTVSVRVWVGRLWAKVAKRMSGGSKFEVQTDNAVAGVRGTSFTVVANTDLSSLVKVYTGTVGVKKNENPYRRRARTQVAGPSRIDKKQWEEVIATAMKQVKVTALGEIAPAEDFTDAGADLQWAMWNQERDEAIQ
ncbi:MAG: FecR family protein [Deltaproteobacteria bacterium]